MKRTRASFDAPVTRGSLRLEQEPAAEDAVSIIPSFIAKTYSMVQAPANARAVRWNKAGTSIIVDQVLTASWPFLLPWLALPCLARRGCSSLRLL